MNTKLLFAAASLTLIAFTGCGERTIRTVPVSGKVLVQGQPAAGAQVVLHPVAGRSGQAFSAVGKVHEDGTFQISAFGKDDGAPPGDYVATVQWFKLVATDGSSGPGPNVLPREYGDPARSPLKVTVKESATTLNPFEFNWR